MEGTFSLPEGLCYGCALRGTEKKSIAIVTSSSDQVSAFSFISRDSLQLGVLLRPCAPVSVWRGGEARGRQAALINRVSRNEQSEC